MTTCSACDRVHADTRKGSPYRWRCVAHPVPLAPAPELENVAPEWRDEPPYRLCRSLRKDLPVCPDFTPLRNGAPQ